MSPQTDTSRAREQHDDARLLPRHRAHSPLLERHRMERAQAAALLSALDVDDDKPLPLRHELTKPGDAEALRGIPVVGGSPGVMKGTQPEYETIKRISRSESIRERTAA